MAGSLLVTTFASLLSIGIAPLAAIAGVLLFVGYHGRARAIAEPEAHRSSQLQLSDLRAHDSTELRGGRSAPLVPKERRSLVLASIGLTATALALPAVCLRAAQSDNGTWRSADATIASLAADLARSGRDRLRGERYSDVASGEIQRRAFEGTLDRDQFERELLALVSTYERQRPTATNDAEAEAVHAAHVEGVLSHELAKRYAKALCPPWSSPFPTMARAGAEWSRVSPDVERFPTRVARSVSIPVIDIDGLPVPQRYGIGGPLDPLPPAPSSPLTSTLPSSVGPHRLRLEVTTRYVLSACNDNLPALETTELVETTQLDLPLNIVAADAPTWIRLESATDTEEAVRAQLHARRLILDPGASPATAIARLDATLGPIAEKSLVYRAELRTDAGTYDLGLAVQVPERRRHPPAARQFRNAVEVRRDELPGDVATIRFSPAIDVAEAILAGESPSIVGSTIEVTVPIERNAVPKEARTASLTNPDLLRRALEPTGTVEMRACCERATNGELTARELLAALAGLPPSTPNKLVGFQRLAGIVFAMSSTPSERTALAPYLIATDRLLLHRQGRELRYLVARNSLVRGHESTMLASGRSLDDLSLTAVIHSASVGGRPITLGGERRIVSLPIVLATPADIIVVDASPTLSTHIDFDVEWWIDWRIDSERRLTLDRHLWPTPLASIRQQISVSTR